MGEAARDGREQHGGIGSDIDQGRPASSDEENHSGCEQGRYAQAVGSCPQADVRGAEVVQLPDLPATPAYILLGLYDEASGQRLPVTGAHAGPVEERWVEFGDVEVR